MVTSLGSQLCRYDTNRKKSLQTEGNKEKPFCQAEGFAAGGIVRGSTSALTFSSAGSRKLC